MTIARLAAMAVAAAGLSLVACSRKPQQPVPVAGNRQVSASNELVTLRLKAEPRPDRMPPPPAQADGLTVVDASGDATGGIAGLVPGESWQGEQFAELAARQLQRLAVAARGEDLDGVLAAGFRASSLRPSVAEAAVVALDGGLSVRHLAVADAPLDALTADALLTQLHAFTGGRARVKIKVTGVEADADGPGFGTRVHVSVGGGGVGEALTATWDCRWDSGAPPLLQSIRLEEFDEVSSAAGEPWFVDATRAAIGSNPRFGAQVMRGIEFWSQRLTRIGDMALTGHHGLAVGDVNGDGLEDVYACDAGSLPNQLYLQQPDGSAREVAADWGVAWLEDSRSALLVDLDNDGDQDLVVATIAMIAFAENDGAGKFVLRGGHPGAPYPFSLSAADYDVDGDLDIYACVYSAGDEALTGRRGFEARSPIPFNDAENGGRNVLLANLGGFQFGDVTAAVGLDGHNTRWSFAAAWEDIDRDGDADLYVANDFGRNCLYRNDAGTFVEIAAEAGVEDMAAGMSVAWGDYNRDGNADLYVGNMFSAAGSRVAFQRRLTPGQERMARGNTLFAGAVGARSFTDVSLPAAVTFGGWAWSSALADLNNDGWQDIAIANGYLTNTREDDL